MLNLLYEYSQKFSNTILHPQWISNSLHLKKKLLLSHIKNKKILDLGSGNSKINSYIDSSNILITVDYPLTADAYKIVPDIYSDARKLPFCDKAFDCVLLFEVLEHINEDTLVIEEIQRVLKNGAKLYLSVPSNYPLHDQPYDFRRYTKYGLAFILKKHGFYVEEEKKLGNSIVSSIQLLNLAVLDTVKSIENYYPLLTILLIIPAYILCLINNIIALPFLNISWKGNLNLGLSIVAKKNKG